MSSPGDVFVDHKARAAVMDDGASRRVIGPFVDARDWKCYPGVSDDMTEQLRNAAESVPENSTLFIPPGTYNISDTVWFSRQHNVIFDGVTLDLGTSVPTTAFCTTGVPENHDGTSFLNITSRESGTLTTLAAVVIGTRGVERPNNKFYRGLTVVRTPGGNASTNRLYAGIVLFGPFECTFEDFHVSHFREGIVLTSDTQGCAHNRVIRPKTIDCRYGITLHHADNGWTNANYIKDGRSLVTTTITGDADWSDPNKGRFRWEHFRVLWSTTTSAASPNQNYIENMNWESPCARKVRLEGSNNVFMNCRYENASVDTYDITVGEASRISANWDTNSFFAGNALDAVYNGRVEYLATTGGINNKNMFYTTERWGYCADHTSAFWAVGGTADDTPLTALQDRQFPYARQDKVVGYAKIPTAIDSGLEGGYVFYDTGGTLRNYIAMETASPFALKVKTVLRVGTDLYVGGDLKLPLALGDPHMNITDISGDMQLQVATGVRAVFRCAGSTETFDFYDSSSNNNDVIRLLDTGGDVRMVLKVNETGISTGMYGAIVFYEESTPSSPAIGNALFLSSTSPFPLQFERGVYINRSGGDYDSRVRSQGSTQLMFWDSSTDRVGILTSSPDASLHVAGAVHFTGAAELDGALNHDGTTVGFYGVTPVTRPATFTVTNHTADKTYDANASTVDELADVLGSLLIDLNACGIIQASVS